MAKPTFKSSSSWIPSAIRFFAFHRDLSSHTRCHLIDEASTGNHWCQLFADSHCLLWIALIVERRTPFAWTIFRREAVLSSVLPNHRDELLLPLSSQPSLFAEAFANKQITSQEENFPFLLRSHKFYFYRQILGCCSLRILIYTRALCFDNLKFFFRQRPEMGRLGYFIDWLCLLCRLKRAKTDCLRSRA